MCIKIKFKVYIILGQCLILHWMISYLSNATLLCFHYLYLKHVSDILNSMPNWDCTFWQVQMFYCLFLCIGGSPFFLKSKAKLRKFIVHKNDCVLFPLIFGSLGKVIMIAYAKWLWSIEHIWWWPLRACNKVEASFSVGWQPHFSIDNSNNKNVWWSSKQTKEIMQKELNRVILLT